MAEESEKTVVIDATRLPFVHDAVRAVWQHQVETIALHTETLTPEVIDEIKTIGEECIEMIIARLEGHELPDMAYEAVLLSLGVHGLARTVARTRGDKNGEREAADNS